ncbi:PIR protein [Plasmodium ovale]|uniref:PIR protein n=1 Tax=Plasmodium ovale TaxID=36330 RepID=A0A1D3JGD5_PLAOA|nr:PIR protein [Plasmodium ovale]
MWKEFTNFSEFSDAALLPGEINNVENWINTFKEKLLTIYDTTILGDFNNVQDKRCRDLNYYISYVLYYIPKITKHTEDSTEIIDRFERFINGIFSLWGKLGSQANFKCSRAQKEYTTKMDLIKELDDYCENKRAFKTKILEKYDKTTCCKYAKLVNQMKRDFHKYILNGHVKKDDEDFHFDNNCTLKDIGQTFPDITCNENSISEIKSDELPTPYGHGHSSVIYPEDSFNSSPAKIAFTSVSTLLGACLSGLYLYKHSFIGNWLRNSQNKNIFPTEDIYDDVNNKFSETPLQYLDNPEENNTFNIAYDPKYN